MTNKYKPLIAWCDEFNGAISNEKINELKKAYDATGHMRPRPGDEPGAHPSDNNTSPSGSPSNKSSEAKRSNSPRTSSENDSESTK